MIRMSAGLVSIATAVAVTACVRVKEPAVRPTRGMPGATLWKDPGNLRTKDVFYGQWGAARAPLTDAVYTFVEQKHTGTNPGMTVRDPEGREWSVKQIPPGALDLEPEVEVTLSRLLSAIGYYQPPQYFLPQFTLKDAWGSHIEVGGRFRLKDKSLKEIGHWSWAQNPFIGSRPYNGLLVLMMMFNSTDLKEDNNSIYEYRNGDRVERWFAVRDLGSALGDTRRLGPYKGNADAFEQEPYIIGVTRNRVQFAYTGYYERYVRNRISPDDVVWTSRLLGSLTEKQWRDAFQAGGYDEEIAGRFIGKLREKIRAGEELRRRTHS
jgi:hypothetical protein